MGYQALLFCPDEKTARTVTQVLVELEFTVEPCLEPFAAVKKLMGGHFDAIVVDCDNEQNATLLFKSARNSTSNQASLAVAVVEGQAGVAKAFRIGANLVLTKPINIEQSKGTLRVARGLLRKGEPAKAATAPASASTAAAKPAAAKSAAPAKPAAPVAPATPVLTSPQSVATAAISTPRPASAPISAPPLAHPAVAPAKAATASSAPVSAAQSQPHAEIAAKASMPQPAAPVASAAAATKLPAPFDRTAPLSASAKVAAAAPVSGRSDALPSAYTKSFSGGAASAPAPAREVPALQPEVPPSRAVSEADAVLDKPVEEVSTETADFVGAAPSFTFGGANVPESGARKKVLLVLAGVLVVAAALYAGWSYFQGRTDQPVSSPAKTVPAPSSTPKAAKPVSSTPNPAAAATPTLSTSSSQPAQPATNAGPSSGTGDNDSGSASPTDSAKPTTSPAKVAVNNKTGPLVVKPSAAAHAKRTAADTAAPASDTAAPSVPEIAIVMPGSSAPPNILTSGGSGPAPVLQTMNISQGVSQGLLIRKVQPQYPRNALTMHVEGSVQLMATVSASGNVTAVKILSGDALLTKAATDAVKQWKYKPYRLNGEPVEIQTQITVNFALPH